MWKVIITINNGSRWISSKQVEDSKNDAAQNALKKFNAPMYRLWQDVGIKTIEVEQYDQKRK